MNPSMSVVALELLKKHQKRLGKDYEAISAALAERDAFDQECRALKVEVEGLRASQKSLHDEYTQAFIAGLSHLRKDLDAVVSEARHGADIAMAMRSE